jgi:hypothetical protein
MVTLNPFKTLTCHDCQQWIQRSLDLSSRNEDKYHNEERDAEEEFKFMGIPIAGENDGDSEESWERESWDTGDESATDKDSLMINFQWANWDTSEESKQREESPLRVPQPRTVHTFATEEIAFWVGPRKDGIVKTNPTPPHYPYYQLLSTPSRRNTRLPPCACPFQSNL